MKKEDPPMHAEIKHKIKKYIPESTSKQREKATKEIMSYLTRRCFYGWRKK